MERRSPTPSESSPSPSTDSKRARSPHFLSAEHGIGVRDGRFCAHPVLARLGLSGGAVRASLGLGSSSDDVTRLVDAVNILVSNQRDWKYVKTGRCVEPCARDPPLPRSPQTTMPAQPSASELSSVPEKLERTTSMAAMAPADFPATPSRVSITLGQWCRRHVDLCRTSSGMCSS